MNARTWMLALLPLVAAVGAARADTAKLSVSDGTGPNPALPKPNNQLFPTIDVAPSVGWTDGGAPTAAPGLEVRAFATALVHPRWLYVLPNGDVLVAETNAPVREDDNRGIVGWVTEKF